MAEAQLSIDVAGEGSRAVVRLTGELDVGGAPALADALRALADDDTTEEVVVDAAGVEFLDSSGLRALLSGREQVVAAGRSFRLDPRSRAVDRILDMTGTRALLAG